MKIDWQTLQDLGILQPDGRQLSLFDWANRCRTGGGTQRLRDHFRDPLSDTQELRERQEAVRFLAEHAGFFDSLLGGSAWLELERYMEASFFALAHPNALFRWLDSWWMRALNRELYDSVRAALSLVQMLVRGASDDMRQARTLELPPLLARWLEAVDACLLAPAMLELRDGQSVHRRRPPGVLWADSLLRSQEFQPLRELAGLVYQIDALCAMAQVTRERGLVFPEFLDGETPRLEAEGVYHPLLDAPVANPVHFDSDTRLLFLTGPNMAGKSTYLKSVGVAVFLAQLGMGVPATSLRLVPFQCLFSGINTTDNLRLGQSYFFREVRRVREVGQLLAGGSAALVIFDEMFKGTNLKDASDASLAVLSGFAACRTSAFIIASHLSELTESMDALEAIRYAHFGAEVRDGGPVFDYRLRTGVSDQRLGMLILEREKVLPLLARLRASATIAERPIAGN